MADNGLSNLSALKRLAVKIGEYESTDMVPANNVTEAIDILTQILEGPVAPIEDPEFEGTPTAPDITSESPDDAIANKKYVDDSIEMLGTVVDIKGTKATVADLEAITDAEPGDLWFVAETNSEYIYTSAEEWEEFGPTIDLSGYSLSTNLASEYSASATYAVGDLCTKDSVLYRCNTAIASPEAWTAAHWTATDVITEAQIKNVKDYGLGNVNGAVVMNDVDNNIANGVYSTAEGYNTRATGNYAHAEGFNMQNAFAKYRGATGQYSHSEGYSTTASGQSSHAEGEGTKASSGGAHAEGYNTTASGVNSHVEGQASLASGSNSHAEGESTLASGSYSHAEGHGDEPTANYPTTGAQNDGAHSEGYMTKATGIGAHAEGKYTIASGEGSHAEGYGEGINTSSPIASARGAHAEGLSTLANGMGAHAEGKWTKASGAYSHAEGTGAANAVPNQAGAEAAHTEGYHTTIDLNGGIGAHAEGYGNHVYGTNCDGMHIEGKSNSSYGGEATHIEGYSNYVKAHYAHVEGEGNLVYGKTSHVFGKYSVSDGSNPSNTENTYRTYVEIVGNGTGTNDRSNARTLDWNGNETLAGKLTVGAGPTNNMDVATKKYADDLFGEGAENLADTYSSSAAYSIGDYCVYDGGLYKCNTAIASPGEAWNASHWTEVTLSDELSTVAEASANNLSDEYSSTSSYDVGDYCVYEGDLYICNTAIASPGEAWNAAHWTRTTVAAELGPKEIELNGTLTSGQTQLIFSNAAITANSMVEIYTDQYGVAPTEVTTAAGSITMIFDALESNLAVKVVLK